MSIFTVHETPYLLAILPKVIEVRTIEPHLMIQSINLQNARCICQVLNIRKCVSRS